MAILTFETWTCTRKVAPTSASSSDNHEIYKIRTVMETQGLFKVLFGITKDASTVHSSFENATFKTYSEAQSDAKNRVKDALSDGYKVKEYETQPHFSINKNNQDKRISSESKRLTKALDKLWKNDEGVFTYRQRINNGDFSHVSSKLVGALTSNRRKCCLLYTSPSPRDGLLSRMPSSA